MWLQRRNQCQDIDGGLCFRPAGCDKSTVRQFLSAFEVIAGQGVLHDEDSVAVWYGTVQRSVGFTVQHNTLDHEYPAGFCRLFFPFCRWQKNMTRTK